MHIMHYNYLCERKEKWQRRKCTKIFELIKGKKKERNDQSKKCQARNKVIDMWVYTKINKTKPENINVINVLSINYIIIKLF